MKKSRFAVFTILFLLAASAHELFAIEQLRIALQDTNVVLSWPSVTNETYLIQHRATLDPADPWQTLAIVYPAKQNTNWTVFTHTNQVQMPAQQGGTNGGGGGPPPPMSLLSGGEGSDSGFTTSGRRVIVPPPPPPLPTLPPLPWEASTVTQRSASGSFSSLNGENGGSANAESTGPAVGQGFYRVVRTGPHFWGITNGMVISGKLTMPIEIGVDSTERLSGLQIYTGTDPDVHIPIQGIEFLEPDGEMPTAYWDTTLMPNGTFPIHFNVSVSVGSGSYIVESAAVTVTVSNQVWFPDPWNVAGFYFPVTAQSIHTNGTWHIDFYKSPLATGATNYVTTLSGTIDGNGFLSYQGYPSIFLNLTDQSGNQLPNRWYELVVFTQPSGASQQAAGPGTTNRVWVEPVWPTNSYRTQFGIGYMPVFGNPVGGNVSAGVLQALVQAIYTAAETRPNGLGVHPLSGSSQAPLELLNQTSFTTLLTSVLRDDDVRNFYYFGHGGPTSYGAGAASGYTSISDLKFVLGNNFTNPLLGTNGAPTPHPYRFVYIDGCKTADGNLCKAFGIPKIMNMSTNDFINRGMRYRAYMGWTGYLVTGIGNNIDQQYVAFMEHFYDGWKTPINGHYRTLREAHTYASNLGGTLSQPLPWAKNLVIYGYEGLLWPDTLP